MTSCRCWCSYGSRGLLRALANAVSYEAMAKSLKEGMAVETPGTLPQKWEKGLRKQE